MKEYRRAFAATFVAAAVAVVSVPNPAGAQTRLYRARRATPSSLQAPPSTGGVVDAESTSDRGASVPAAESNTLPEAPAATVGVSSPSTSPPSAARSTKHRSHWGDVLTMALGIGAGAAIGAAAGGRRGAFIGAGAGAGAGGYFVYRRNRGRRPVFSPLPGGP